MRRQLQWRKEQKRDEKNQQRGRNTKSEIKRLFFWFSSFLWDSNLYHVPLVGDSKGAYRVFVGRPEGKRPRGRPMRRWGDNIKTHLQAVEWGAWTGLIWLRTGTGGGALINAEVKSSAPKKWWGIS
jgi:hypothetical protein